MCYTVFLSTDPVEDLSVYSGDLMTLVREESNDPLLAYLQFDNRWWLTDIGNGCSCEFRHQEQIEWNGRIYPHCFDEPQEWMHEDPERVEGSRQLFDVLDQLLRDGFKVDLVDSWEGKESEILAVDVPWSTATRESFRLFEGRVVRFS